MGQTGLVKQIAWLLLAAAAGAVGAELPETAAWAATLATKTRSSTDIPYFRFGGWEGKLDVYRPRVADGPTPVVVWIHGGGWMGGDKQTYFLRTLPYLEMGFAVVNVEYRLGSRALAPAAVQDCRCALRWVFSHAREMQFDTARVVVAGDSAGGHLALMTGMLAGSEGLDDLCPGDGPMPVAAIINNRGITDVNDLLSGEHRRVWAVQWLGGQPGKDDVARRVSPLRYVRPGLPPILTVHGDQDPTVPYQHAVRLHEALTKAGVKNRLVTVPGGGHGGYPEAEELRIHAAVREFLSAVVPQKPAGKVSEWAALLAGRYRSSTEIPYLMADGWEGKLNVYRPRGAKAPVPVVLDLHGGGWMGGDKETETLWALPYIEMGYAVVIPDYRLGSQAPAPAAVEDCRCALRWVFSHAAEYGFDSRRVVVAGSSAGGHLALMAGLADGFDERCPGEGPVRVAAIVSESGIADVGELLRGPNRRTWAVQWMGGRGGAERVSPLTWVRAGAPPVLLVHGDRDAVVPYSQAVRLAKALRVELVTLPGGGHGYSAAEQLRVSEAVRRFLEQAWRPVLP